MITAKFVNMYGWVGVSIMALLLVLVWLKVLPKSLYIVAFLVAVSLFVGRVVLRLLLTREERRLRTEEPPPGER